MSILFLVAVSLTLLYVGRAYWAWVAPAALGLAYWAWQGIESPVLFWIFAVLLAIPALVFGFRPLRRALVTPKAFRLIAPILPRMSETEKIALEAGTVWWDADLFSGKPSWKRLVGFRPRGLTEEERDFLDGPVEQVCRMATDWEIVQRRDLPPDVWEFLREKRFFGMIIPKEYGGLGFSALAHSAVITKLSSHSATLSVTAMVPNSLGPAELLLHYGTEEQKKHYLPRLARGEELPAFALTEPMAGSDAGSMQSTGVVCRGKWEGKEVLGLRLNWNKRYITLSSVATVLGLAFRLYDPDHLLGETEDLGITCALIPPDLPGVEIGKRHDPLGIPFHNGPTQGKDVFVPLDAIIGGREMAGRGWMMLMQTLAAGRGISLPSMAAGCAQLATRTVGAYGTIREQFNTPIGRFEGVEERMAFIGGMTYLMDAARTLTVGAIDEGERPSVVSAIVKCYLTEGMRSVVNDAMDVVAGAGICRGPSNVLAGAYGALPIGITVEGANILTRSMIIFGQGALRCHPFAQKEVEAAEAKDLAAFDRNFFGHVGFVFSNLGRSLVLGLTDGRFVRAPVTGPAARYFGRFTRRSAGFALVGDFAMGMLGGALKRKEKLTGRLADALSWMYLGTAALKRFVDEGQPERDLPYLHWACQESLHRVDKALDEFLDNFPSKPVAAFLRLMLFPTRLAFGLGGPASRPSDRTGGAVARSLLENGEARAHLTRDIYVPPLGEPGLGRLESALEKVVRAHEIDARIREAVRSGKLDKKPRNTLAERAKEAGVIGAEDLAALAEARAAQEEAVAVDAFEPAAYAASHS